MARKKFHVPLWSCGITYRKNKHHEPPSAALIFFKLFSKSFLSPVTLLFGLYLKTKKTLMHCPLFVLTSYGERSSLMVEVFAMFYIILDEALHHDAHDVVSVWSLKNQFFQIQVMDICKRMIEKVRWMRGP